MTKHPQSHHIQQEQEQKEQSNAEEQGYSVTNEEISESLLLRCWIETCKPVNEAIRLNKESGAKYPELYVHYFNYSELMDVSSNAKSTATKSTIFAWTYLFDTK
jgi:hypothetical protein